MKEGAGIFRPRADPIPSRLVLIVAGEASADLHGSHLVRAMKTLDPHLTFWGIGGRMMEEAGVRILVPSSQMAVVGLTEVLSRLARILKAYFQLKSILKNRRPDLLILIDYPDFNITLARSARRFRVPVLYYISPQVWAWRSGRVKKLARRVDRMAVILPFEESFYRQRGISVEYVGHPLLDAAPAGLIKEESLAHFGLSGSAPVLGLLPGSREEEVTSLLPSMVKAAEILKARYPHLLGLLPRASTISSDTVQPIIARSSVRIETTEGDIYRVLSACDLVFVASGTATLETAIMGVPMVILYRVSPLSYWVGKRVIRVPHIGLVNLVAGEEVVPELIQNEITPERLAREAQDLLVDGDRRGNMIRKLASVREKLGQGSASERTARMALEMMS